MDALTEGLYDEFSWNLVHTMIEWEDATDDSDDRPPIRFATDDDGKGGMLILVKHRGTDAEIRRYRLTIQPTTREET